jgi:hypothetical protein
MTALYVYIQELWSDNLSFSKWRLQDDNIKYYAQQTIGFRGWLLSLKAPLTVKNSCAQLRLYGKNMLGEPRHRKHDTMQIND